MTEATASNQEQELPAEGTEAPEAAAPEAADQAQQLADMKDQLLRALAEVENVRRRTQKEIDDTRKYAVSSFAKEMLGVADNFARALTAVPKDSADPTLKNLVVGVEATGRQLAAVMERFGIRKMDLSGKLFDPNFHQVMMEVDDQSHPPGTIVQVMQDGYMIHDRLLREALVGVAKGGPTATKVDTSA